MDDAEQGSASQGQKQGELDRHRAAVATVPPSIAGRGDPAERKICGDRRTCSLPLPVRNWLGSTPSAARAAPGLTQSATTRPDVSSPSFKVRRNPFGPAPTRHGRRQSNTRDYANLPLAALASSMIRWGRWLGVAAGWRQPGRWRSTGCGSRRRPADQARSPPGARGHRVIATWRDGQRVSPGRGRQARTAGRVGRRARSPAGRVAAPFAAGGAGCPDAHHAGSRRTDGPPTSYAPADVNCASGSRSRPDDVSCFFFFVVCFSFFPATRRPTRRRPRSRTAPPPRSASAETRHTSVTTSSGRSAWSDGRPRQASRQIAPDPSRSERVDAEQQGRPRTP